MSSVSLRLFALPLAALLISGCGAGINPATTGVTTAAVTSNWSFHVQDPQGAGDFPDLTSPLAGAVTFQGSQVTATLRSSGCVSPTLDIAFTGNVDASGNFTLTSTNMPNNIATMTGTLPTAANGFRSFGGLAISGSGPCAFPKDIALIGAEYQPVTGTYAGTLTATNGTGGTASLTQASANPDGQFPESGTLTLGTGTCANTFSLAGFVSGATLNANLNSTSGPAATATLVASLNQEATQVSVTMNVISTGCNSGSFTGMFSAQ